MTLNKTIVNNNINNNKTTNIILLNFLLEEEIIAINQILKDYDVLVLFNKVHVTEIISKIKAHIRTKNYTLVTIHLMANIIDFDENIFFHLDQTTTIEQIIKLLNQSSFNVNKQLVHYNLKAIFKSTQSAYKDKEREENNDKIILDSKTELVDEIKKYFQNIELKKKKKNDHVNPFRVSLTYPQNII